MAATSWLHTSVRSLCFLPHLGPAALGSVNHVETCTLVCNLYVTACNAHYSEFDSLQHYPQNFNTYVHVLCLHNLPDPTYY